MVQSLIICQEVRTRLFFGLNRIPAANEYSKWYMWDTSLANTRAGGSSVDIRHKRSWQSASFYGV